MKKKIIPVLLVLGAVFMYQCKGPAGEKQSETISNDSLMTLIQYNTFQYFWDGAEPVSGLARERLHMDDEYPMNDKHVVTVGGGGFGLMAILVGIDRGFISREEGLERLEQIGDFLESADRFHGAWPHWLNGETGRVQPFSKKDDGGDIVETAFMTQGMICVYEYFKGGNEREKALALKMNDLWQGVEWDWYQQDQDILYWHWSDKQGWAMNHRIMGYNECLIAYVMGASSPDHAIRPETYHEGWARSGDIKSKDVFYDMPLELDHKNTERGGPLFWAHYSFLGLNPKNLKDRYGDYWRHNTNHVKINRQYCIENPNDFKGYGEDCWGLTSSYTIEGIREYMKGEKELPQYTDQDPPVSYAGHKPDRDYSVITPTAAMSSFPYAPEECMQAARFFYEDLGDRLMGPYGFYDAFSLEFDWFPKKYLAIDQGPIVIMMENYRSGLLWDLFMQNEDVKNGLALLGFTY